MVNGFAKSPELEIEKGSASLCVHAKLRIKDAKAN